MHINFSTLLKLLEDESSASSASSDSMDANNAGSLESDIQSVDYSGTTSKDIASVDRKVGVITRKLPNEVKQFNH